MEWTPERIRQLRKACGATQKEFAVRLGFGSAVRVVEIENDRRPVSPRIERLLDMINRYESPYPVEGYAVEGEKP